MFDDSSSSENADNTSPAVTNSANRPVSSISIRGRGARVDVGLMTRTGKRDVNGSPPPAPVVEPASPLSAVSFPAPAGATVGAFASPFSQSSGNNPTIATGFGGFGGFGNGASGALGGSTNGSATSVQDRAQAANATAATVAPSTAASASEPEPQLSIKMATTPAPGPPTLVPVENTAVASNPFASIFASVENGINPLAPIQGVLSKDDQIKVISILKRYNL